MKLAQRLSAEWQGFKDIMHTQRVYDRQRRKSATERTIDFLYGDTGYDPYKLRDNKLRLDHYERMNMASNFMNWVFDEEYNEERFEYQADFFLGRDPNYKNFTFMRDYVLYRYELADLGKKAASLDKTDGLLKKHEREKSAFEKGNLSEASINYLYRYDPKIYPVTDPMFDVFPTKQDALVFMHQERLFRKQLTDVMNDREALDRAYYSYEGESMKINNVYNTMMYMYNRSSEYDVEVDFVATRIINNVFETTDAYLDFENNYYSMLNAGYKTLSSFMFQRGHVEGDLFPKNKWERKNERLEQTQREKSQRQIYEFEANFLEEYGYDLPF